MKWVGEKHANLRGPGVGGNIGKKIEEGSPIFDRAPLIEDLFFSVPRKFHEFSGNPVSAVENRRGPRSPIGGPCDFRRQTRVLFLSEKERVFPELRRSRGKYRNRKKYRNLRGRPSFRFTCFFPLLRRGRGKKHGFFSSAPQGQRKKTRVFLRFPSSPPIPSESEGTRRLPSKIACDFRRQARVLFLSEKGRVFPYSERVGGNIEMGGNDGKKDGSYFYRPIHGSVKIASMRKERSKIGLPSSIFLSSNRKDVFPDPFGSEKNTRRAKKRAERPNSKNLDVRKKKNIHVEETLVLFSDPVPPENRMRFSGGTGG